MALRKRSRLRKPRARRLTVWIFSLIDSAPALVMRCWKKVRMLAQWRLSISATRRTGSRRLQRAQWNQRLKFRSAAACEWSSHSSMAASRSDQARATLVTISRSRLKARASDQLRPLGLRSQSYLVPLRIGSPSASRARCSRRRTSSTCLAEGLRDVELVEHDLLLGIGQVLARRADVGLPHVHRHRLDSRALLGRPTPPEPIQRLLPAVVAHVQHPRSLQVAGHGHVLVPLLKRG